MSNIKNMFNVIEDNIKHIFFSFCPITQTEKVECLVAWNNPVDRPIKRYVREQTKALIDRVVGNVRLHEC